LDFGSVVSPSLSSHGATRLDPFQGHAAALAKPCKPRFIAVIELMTCCVPEDPAFVGSRIPTRGVGWG
jgi:hypothetical protein